MSPKNLPHWYSAIELCTNRQGTAETDECLKPRFTISEVEEECLYCHTTRERAQTAN